MCRRAVPLIALLGVVAVIASCGGSVSVNNRGEVAVGAKTLDVASIPFTFRYPTSFQEATDSSVKAAHAVALVGIPGEDSYIAVHLNGKGVMSLDALEAQARHGLGAGVLATARERHAGIAMVAVRTSVTARSDLQAIMYGFSASGSTWLIECRSNAGNRASMKQWCVQALDSLKLRA